MNGITLRDAGSSEQGINFLEQAILRGSILAEAGNEGAENMMSKSMQLKGDYLRHLGRLGECEDIYNKGFKISKKLDDKMQIAGFKAQLGNLYLLQQKHKTAITAYEDAKNYFEQLGDEKMYLKCIIKVVVFMRIRIISKRRKKHIDKLLLLR